MSNELHPNEMIVTEQMLLEAYETLGKAYIDALHVQYERQTGVRYPTPKKESVV